MSDECLFSVFRETPNLIIVILTELRKRIFEQDHYLLLLNVIMIENFVSDHKHLKNEIYIQ